jgi:hypothetical protein
MPRARHASDVFSPVPMHAHEILFVNAEWSVPAQEALSALSTARAAEPAFARIGLRLLDADSARPLLEQSGWRPEGQGETFWLRDGRVIATRRGYAAADVETLIALNRQLLAAD